MNAALMNAPGLRGPADDSINDGFWADACARYGDRLICDGDVPELIEDIAAYDVGQALREALRMPLDISHRAALRTLLALHKHTHDAVLAIYNKPNDMGDM